VLLALPCLLPATAHAAFLSGEALDTAADVASWIVLFIAPIIGLAVFWIVHILPEKIAEKKQHPQAGAIQCLCLLSLVFGGLLWPIAWLWAYTKPVLYKRAYGVDKVPHGQEHAAAPEPSDADAAEEIRALRQRLVELEARLASKSSAATAGA
jgi:hypothetical protein